VSTILRFAPGLQGCRAGYPTDIRNVVHDQKSIYVVSKGCIASCLEPRHLAS
jgi:hypothetical protein